MNNDQVKERMIDLEGESKFSMVKVKKFSCVINWGLDGGGVFGAIQVVANEDAAVLRN